MIDATKPLYRIDLDTETAEQGCAADILKHSVERETFEDRYGLRKPFGIYNISISRLDTRLERTARSIRDFMMANPTIPKAESRSVDLMSDYLESCIYAAAEHVDDLESCLKCFFSNAQSYSKSKTVRRFKDCLKRVRRIVSAFANSIKHQQARIRLNEIEFIHDSNRMVLIGFFVEGVENGKVGPSKIVQGEDVQVISVASFLWEIFIFAHEAADLLADALAEIMATASGNADRPRWAILRKAVIEIARVPNFSFDGPHPFERATIRLESEKATALFSSADLYGSLGNRWSMSKSHAFGGTVQSYQGDGVTKSFALVAPKNIRLQHWQ